MPSSRFVVLNAASARFECTFGRGCEGVCCRNGRPPINEGEMRRIDRAFPEALTFLRPEAREVVERDGYVSRRTKGGARMLRVVRGWCVFFNQGCVLQKVGEARRSKFAYKPYVCILFPLDVDRHGNWFVRQKGYSGEDWELSCLTPGANTPLAIDTLREELAVAARMRP